MSKFLSVSQEDAIKALIMAGLTAFLSTLIAILNAGAMPSHDDWKKVGIMTLSGTLSYILKQWLTNSDGKFAKPEPAKPE